MVTKKRYAFVILNWNGKKDTRDCLASLDQVEYEDDFDIVVVDNGSEDDSINYLKRFADRMVRQVTFASLPKNAGFTGGHIEGLRHTNAEVICLLNNDAVVASNILSEADSLIEAIGPNFGTIGGRAYFWNESQKAFDIWNEFFTYQKIDPVTAAAHTIKGDPGESLAPKIVDTVSGACVFINRNAINEVGYLDDSFFAYYEETDLFARFKRVGYEVYYCPTLRYWHRYDPNVGSHGASTKHLKNFSLTLMLRNQFFFAFKNFETIYLLRFLAWYYKRFGMSLFKYPIDAKNRNMHSVIIKTTIQNLYKIPNLLSRRNDVKKLLQGKPGYNELIVQQAQRKTVAFTVVPPEDIIDIILDKCESNNRVHIRSSIKCSADFAHRCTKLNVPEDKIKALSAASARTDSIIVIESKDITKKLIIKELDRVNDGNPYFRTEDGITVFNRQHLKNIADQELSLDAPISWTHVTTPMNRFRASINNILRRPRGLFSTFRLYVKYRLRLGGILGATRSLLGLLKNSIMNRARLAQIVRAGAHKQRLYVQRSIEASKETTLLSEFPVDKIPVFINCRDRVDTLKKTINSIKRAGFKEVYLIDNQSTYPKLLEYYHNTDHQVVLLGENMGHKAPWESLAVKLLSEGRPYVVTDPDVVLSEKYTPQIISKFMQIFDQYPGYVKIGAALSIDDLPTHYEHKNTVQKWEQQFWSNEIANSSKLIAYDAEIDTTFAIYRPNLGYITLPSIRIGGDYTAKHLPWYQNSTLLDEEDEYYKSHASSAVNTWNKNTLPEYLKEYSS